MKAALLVIAALALSGCMEARCPTADAPGFVKSDASGHQVEPAGISTYYACPKS